MTVYHNVIRTNYIEQDHELGFLNRWLNSGYNHLTPICYISENPEASFLENNPEDFLCEPTPTAVLNVTNQSETSF